MSQNQKKIENKKRKLELAAATLANQGRSSSQSNSVLLAHQVQPSQAPLDNSDEIEEDEQSESGSERESEEEVAQRARSAETEHFVQQNLAKLLSGTTAAANSVTISQQVVFLTSLAAGDVRKFVNFVKDGAGRVGNAALEPQWLRFIDDRIREVLLSKLRASSGQSAEEIVALTDPQFILLLRKAMPDVFSEERKGATHDPKLRLRELGNQFNPSGENSNEIDAMLTTVSLILQQEWDLDKSSRKSTNLSTLVGVWLRSIGFKDGANLPKQYFRDEMLKLVDIRDTDSDVVTTSLTIGRVLDFAYDVWKRITDITRSAKAIGWLPPSKEGKHSDNSKAGGSYASSSGGGYGGGKSGSSKSSNGQSGGGKSNNGQSGGRVKSSADPSGSTPAADSDKSGLNCTGCGREGSHIISGCKLRELKIPGYNYDRNVSWAESKAGREWLATHPDMGIRTTLPFPRDRDQKDNTSKRFKKGEFLFSIGDTPGMINHIAKGDSTDTLEMRVFIHTPNQPIIINCLFDTGALQANYGSIALRDMLLAQGVKAHPCSGSVCSCFGECRQCIATFVFWIKLTKVSSIQNDSFPITVKIIDIVYYDLIIGRHTLKANNLLMDSLRTIDNISNSETSLHWIREQGGLVVWPTTSSRGNTSVNSDTTLLTNPVEYLRVQKKDLLDFEIDDSESMADLYGDALIDVNWWESENEPASIQDIQVNGPDGLRKGINELLIEFSMVFSRELDPNSPSVDIPPLELDIDVIAWESLNTQRVAPRPQTLTKQKFLREQTQKLLERKIIQPSTASSYSQVHLAEKPGGEPGEYRYCIDYRSLNKVTRSAGYPLPNPRSIFQRLGTQQAEYYGVIDFTSGYHQTPLSQNSRRFTAFITYLGLFEFCRVPFGLKGAPSYFQRIMETVIFIGLVFIICEIYLDDIIVYGKTQDIYLANLRQILERMRRHNVKGNPKKTRLGLTEIEYVGHVVNSEGMSFSKKKLDGVYNAPQPKTQKDLRSFLGLANYFRQHVNHYASRVAPLQAMLKGYTPSKVLKWNTIQEEAFKDTRQAINDCPTLAFLREGGEVIVETDACDYGVGGQLLQRFPPPDGDYPIAFVSKALTQSQIDKWAPNEKEAYGIYYTLNALEYLIRDIHFTLRTDHRNLTFISQAGSPRVLRWKLSIQEYDFDLEYQKGSDNFVPDRFSRDFETLHEISEEPEHLHAISISEVHVPHEKYKLISAVHNSIAGHHGVDRTMAKLIQQDQSWAYMRLHVRAFIHRCPCCQKMRSIAPDIQTVRYTTGRYEPMERLNIDTIGPLPEDSKHNKYIIVIIDCFTRFLELYPTPDTGALGAANALLHHTGRYGAPCELLSDNGSQYVNKLIEAFVLLIGTESVLTLAYSHEENSIVERSNKSIMDHLRAIMFDANVIDNWSDCLPLVQRIMNASKNESMGYSPSQLLFGNAITLDRGIFLPHTFPSADTQHRGVIELPEWLDKMQKMQTTLLELAQRKQRLTDQEHMYPETVPKRKRKAKDKVDKSAPITEYLIGSYVLVAYRESAWNKPPHKLLTKWRGPLRVVNNVGSTYSLQNLVTNKLEDVHVTQLVPFNYDPLVTDPRIVANKDFQAWDAQAILRHRGDPKRRKDLEFLVHWTGFAIEDATWEPWSNVRTTTAMQHYLPQHKALKSLIQDRVIPAYLPEL